MPRGVQREARPHFIILRGWKLIYLILTPPVILFLAPGAISSFQETLSRIDFQGDGSVAAIKLLHRFIGSSILVGFGARRQ